MILTLFDRSCEQLFAEANLSHETITHLHRLISRSRRLVNRQQTRCPRKKQPRSGVTTLDDWHEARDKALASRKF